MYVKLRSMIYGFRQIGKPAAVIGIGQTSCDIATSVYEVPLSSFLRRDRKGAPNLRIKAQPFIVPLVCTFFVVGVFFFFKRRSPEHLLCV